MNNVVLSYGVWECLSCGTGYDSFINPLEKLIKPKRVEKEKINLAFYHIQQGFKVLLKGKACGKAETHQD